MADLTDTINTSAGLPEESQLADGQRVKERPIADLLAADRYLAAKNAAANPWRGLRFSRLLPGGALMEPSNSGG